jgi:hypothetical protein
MNAAEAGDAIVASVHRLMNDYRRKLESPAADGSMRFECECDRVECFDSFRMSVDDYDEIRARPDWFTLSARHLGSDELVIRTSQSYSVVEKAAARHEFQTVIPQTKQHRPGRRDRSGAAPESNRASVGLPHLTGFEDP